MTHRLDVHTVNVLEKSATIVVDMIGDGIKNDFWR